MVGGPDPTAPEADAPPSGVGEHVVAVRTYRGRVTRAGCWALSAVVASALALLLTWGVAPVQAVSSGADGAGVSAGLNGGSGPPGAVTGLRTVSMDGAVGLLWDPVPHATMYGVRVWPVGHPEQAVEQRTGLTHWLLLFFENWKWFRVQVWATNASGAGPVTDMPVVPDATTPRPPRVKPWFTIGETMVAAGEPGSIPCTDQPTATCKRTLSWRRTLNYRYDCKLDQSRRWRSVSAAWDSWTYLPPWLKPGEHRLAVRVWWPGGVHSRPRLFRFTVDRFGEPVAMRRGLPPVWLTLGGLQ